MEPITLKLNKERLGALASTMRFVEYEPTNDKKMKSERSVFWDAKVKVLKKDMDPPIKKEFTLKLKYHEAYQLEIYLRVWLFDQETCYRTSLVRMVADEINQKLT